MNDRYINYNDYRLLYLIKEGSQAAYDVLMAKYDKLIFKVAARYYPYGDKMMDLVQEGRMILVKCIDKFREDAGASFYSYFSISLIRRLNSLVKSDYYQTVIVAEADSFSYNNDLSEINIHKGYRYFDSDIKIRMFDECIIGGMSIKDFALEYNIKYSRAYTLYKDIIYRLKKDIFY